MASCDIFDIVEFEITGNYIQIPRSAFCDFLSEVYPKSLTNYYFDDTSVGYYVKSGLGVSIC